MTWRIIKLEENSAFFNMAIDEAVMNGILEGVSEPTIRFYKWKPSAVSIGRFQRMNDEVNVSRCDKLGIDHVRRVTGGGAVYHDNKGEITYSVIANEELLKHGITETYKEISGWIINGLGRVGISASFAPINDIVVDGKKISGNAQTRKSGVVLQHGTILYDLDIAKMFGVLNISKEKISDKLIKSVEERVTCVKNYADIPQEGLYEALLQSFTEGKEYHIGKWTRSELNSARKLSETVYTTDSWNFSR